MQDSYNLQRFVDAQEGIYPQVLRELKSGRKETHWMWFIFPQLAGLGRTAMAQRYAIRALEEAQAYADRPALGPRVTECTRLGSPRRRDRAQDLPPLERQTSRYSPQQAQQYSA